MPTAQGSIASPTCCASWCCRRRRTWSRAAGATRCPNCCSAAGARPAASPGSICRCGATCSQLFAQSAGDWLDGWFESDPIKAVYGFDGIVGNYASPYTPGSAYVLLHHVFGEVNGRKGAWGHAIGGMGAITQAMARPASRARRRHPRRTAPVREVLVEHGRAVGRRHRGRREAIRGAAVISNLNPKLLYRQTARRRSAAAGLRRAHRALALRLGHLSHERRAVRTAATFTCLPGSAGRSPHRGHHHGARRLSYMDRAYCRRPRARLVERADRRDADPVDAGRRAWRRRASMWPACSASTSRRSCRDGDSWDDHRDDGRRPDDRYRRRFRAQFQSRRCSAGRSSARSIWSAPSVWSAATSSTASSSLDQMFSARPVLGHGDYRGPSAGPLHVRCRHPSRRRRHRRAGPQRRARGARRFQAPASAGTPSKTPLTALRIAARRQPAPVAGVDISPMLPLIMPQVRGSAPCRPRGHDPRVRP